jgi:hypothetical protein
MGLDHGAMWLEHHTLKSSLRYAIGTRLTKDRLSFLDVVFSRSEKHLGNTTSINGNAIYPAKILVENHFSKINCLTRWAVYTNYTSTNLLSSKDFELYHLYLK